MRCVGPTLLEKELQNLEEQYSFNPEIEGLSNFKISQAGTDSVLFTYRPSFFVTDSFTKVVSKIKWSIMQISDLKPGLISLSTSFGSTICCVLPLTIVLLGLGSGGFMILTMQYRIILYPLGLLGLGTSYWLYFRRKKACEAQVCQMQGKRMNITALVFSTVLMSLVTYVDFFLVSL